jgi:membrane associated rhomboid family serine protease/Flp pilus assembly protein TadD
MLIPIGDDNPVERFPFVNTAIIAVNVLIFLALAFRPDYPAFVKMYALIPELFRPYSFVTHMFFHGSVGHLFGNMLFLGIVGKNVEDRVGHVGYVAFYVIAGLVACGLHIAIVSVAGGGKAPMIGASGAVAGIMAAYAAFFPRNQIKIFYWVLWFFFGTFYIASGWAIGLWFALQLLGSLLSFHAGEATRVAYWAHVGGFGAGLLVALVFNRVVPRDELERSIALYFARGRADRAIDRYERFRKKFPWRTLSPILQHEIAEAYEQQADGAHAMEAYELFLKAHPDDAQAAATQEKLDSLRGIPPPLPTAQGKEETVMQPLVEIPHVEDAALEIEPIDPVERAVSLGRLHFRDKNWDGAIEQFKKVIETQPHSVEGHAYLGVALYQKGLFPEAIQATRQAIELGGESAVAYNNLALAYLANGQKEEAADAWHRALRLDPHNKVARDGLKRFGERHRRS